MYTGAAVGAIFRPSPAAVRARDTLDQGQPEPERRRAIPAVERIEDATERLLRETRTAVVHGYTQALFGARDLNALDAAAVLLRVLEQVAKRAIEQRRIALDFGAGSVVLVDARVDGGALHGALHERTRLERLQA